MLFTQNAVFLHVPKTGGSWVRDALLAAGIPRDEYLVDGDQHADLSYCPHPERFKFAFVRHPLSLYRSYWRYKMGTYGTSDWDVRNPFDVDCAATTFDAFVRNVLAKYPGWCTQMFEDYTGPLHGQIEFVGRFERLADELVVALRLAGETFDETLLRQTPRTNVSWWPAQEAQWSAELASAVLAAEWAAIVRFGYDRTLRAAGDLRCCR